MSEIPPPIDPPQSGDPIMAAPAGYAAGSLPAEPVADTDRIVSIDVLRGFAVMGILMVNIFFMALPMHAVEAIRWRDLPFPDNVARMVVQVFFELKFITLFSFLFGAGLAIQMQRLEATGRRFIPVYVRRLLVLLLIGVFHGVLLWYGDILAVYSLIGFAALLFRNCPPRTLLIWAIAFFIVPVLGLSLIAALDPEASWSESTWSAYVTSPPQASQPTDTPASSSTTGPAALPTARSPYPDVPPAILRFLAFLDDEARIYRSGSFGEILAHRAAYFVIANIGSMPVLYFWRCLALFLLGMAAVKSRFISADVHTPRWGIAAAALAVGLAMELFADRITHHDAIHAAPVAEAFALSYVGSMALSLAYGLIVLALAARPGLNSITRPVAAVGRMALSNYLMHSVVGGLIFCSYGLGQFGSIQPAGLVAIAIGILIVQLIVSPIWLRHFRFGPVEWLWRSATYGRSQPMSRRTA